MNISRIFLNKVLQCSLHSCLPLSHLTTWIHHHLGLSSLNAVGSRCRGGPFPASQSHKRAAKNVAKGSVIFLFLLDSHRPAWAGGRARGRQEGRRAMKQCSERYQPPPPYPPSHWQVPQRLQWPFPFSWRGWLLKEGAAGGRATSLCTTAGIWPWFNRQRE